MAMEHQAISTSQTMGSVLRTTSQQLRATRDGIKFCFGVMNDCFIDSGNVANNDYSELERVFGLTPALSGSVGSGSNGYKAWYKVASLKASLDTITANVDAVINDLN